MTRTGRSRGDETGWERGWDGHQIDQLRRLARLPLADKLTWLEEAHDVARHLASTPESRARVDPSNRKPR